MAAQRAPQKARRDGKRVAETASTALENKRQESEVKYKHALTLSSEPACCCHNQIGYAIGILMSTPAESLRSE